MSEAAAWLVVGAFWVVVVGLVVWMVWARDRGEARALGAYVAAKSRWYEERGLPAWTGEERCCNGHVFFADGHEEDFDGNVLEGDERYGRGEAHPW